ASAIMALIPISLNWADSQQVYTMEPLAINKYDGDGQASEKGVPRKMDLEERLSLIRRNVEEVVTEEELRALLETNERPKAYWGFECSG
ncbi:MAG: hypothetical protein QXN33_05010, partial [Candidatus Bathyarchaeia archaeon]